MLECYRPEYFRQVKAFADRQPEFDYLGGIIKAHTRDRVPGGVWVWRATKVKHKLQVQDRPPIVAICGMAYLNRADAWLYGMRVDDRCKGLGIATRLTRELFRIAAETGHTWVGLDTLNHSRKAPVFRITEKLGMNLEGIYATAGFWNLPTRFRMPRLTRASRIPDRWKWSGVRVMFHEQYPRWLWSRIRLARGIGGQGRWLSNEPVQIVRRKYGRIERTSINLLVRPRDLKSVLARLLAFGAGRKRGLVINYPQDWTPELRRAARLLVPELKIGRNCFFVSWRIYGKELR
jgi:GNAT superfamily N-acetyltransferase